LTASRVTTRAFLVEPSSHFGS